VSFTIPSQLKEMASLDVADGPVELNDLDIDRMMTHIM